MRIASFTVIYETTSQTKMSKRVRQILAHSFWLLSDGGLKLKFGDFGKCLFIAMLLSGILSAACIAESEPNAEAETINIAWDESWENASFSNIHTDDAILFISQAEDKKGIVVGVNAGHGTSGGTDENNKTYCHPDMSPKTTGGSTAEGEITATAVSVGMQFNDGTPEATVTLSMALILRDKLLEKGYDVLMLRSDEDVQLDNVARTILCNYNANCHIALHWDGDSCDYDKGAYFASVPDAIKYMEPVASVWEEDNRLGQCLIEGLADQGLAIFDIGSMDMDLTQTSYSSVPSVDIELGNQCSDHSEEMLNLQADGLLEGIESFFFPNDLAH